MADIKINFHYEGRSIIIFCKENLLIKDAINKFCSKVKINSNSIYCLYAGMPLDENKKISEIKPKNKEDKIAFAVASKNKEDQEKVESIVKPSQAICPECGEITLITFENYRIKSTCQKGHEKENILFDEFEKTQIIDESKIKCDICKNLNKSMTYNKEFYFCSNCKENICPLCKTNHNKSHIIVKYDQKNYICFKHGDNYALYCKDCKLNLCSACENEHNGHEIVTLGKLFPNKKDLEKKMKELKDNMNKLKEQIKNIVDILNQVNKNMEKYCEIINYLNNSFDIKSKNYEVLKSIQDIDTNYIINDISNIIEEEKITRKFRIIYNIYAKMTLDENADYGSVLSEYSVYTQIAPIPVVELKRNLSATQSPTRIKNSFNNITVDNNHNSNNNFGMEGTNMGLGGINSGMGEINPFRNETNMGLGGINSGMGIINPGMNEIKNDMKMGMEIINPGMNEINIGLGEMNNDIHPINMDMCRMNNVNNNMNMGMGRMNNLNNNMNIDMGGMNTNNNNKIVIGMRKMNSNDNLMNMGMGGINNNNNNMNICMGRMNNVNNNMNNPMGRMNNVNNNMNNLMGRHFGLGGMNMGIKGMK